MTGFINALPGAVSQGLIWGIMAIGVYITYKILDIADLTVDGSFCTGGAVFAVLFSGGVSLPGRQPHPPLPRKNGSKKSFPSQAENWKMSCLVCLD